MACKTLHHRMGLLSQHLPTKGMLFHTELKNTRLTVWHLSSKPCRTEDIQRWLSKQFSLLLTTHLNEHTKVVEITLLAGVAKGIRTPFI